MTWLAWKASGSPQPTTQTPSKNRAATVRDWAPYRSKLEADYAKRLEVERAAGLLVSWHYEPTPFQIGGGCGYTVDFKIERPDGSIEMHEVKGYWREAAKVRLKIAAERFPEFRWFIVVRKRGTWAITPVRRAA